MSSSFARSAGSVPAKVATAFGGLVQFLLCFVEFPLGLLQNLERHDLGLLQGAAEVAVGFQDRGFALDLVLRFLRDAEVDAADLVEAVGDVAAGELHPRVGRAFPHADLAVGDLVDHRLGVVADGVEAFGDLAIAVADLHGGDVLAHDLVEVRGLVQRAGDDRDAVLVEVGDLLQQGVDRGVFALARGRCPCRARSSVRGRDTA